MTEPDTKNGELAFMLGRIQGDVKHILTALTRNQEQFNAVDKKLGHMDRRMDALEKFQTKIMTIVAIVGPVLTIMLTAGIKYFGG